MTIYLCDNDQRRVALRAQTALNGIDYLQVSPSQLQLSISFVNAISSTLQTTLSGLSSASVQIAGGVRITGITAKNVTLQGSTLVVTVSSPGDFSQYTLSLVGAGGGTLAGLDPALSQISFSFKVGCPSDFDCAPVATCAPSAPPPPPDINYLAKDFASFSSLMQDRLALLVPAWTETSPADIGNTLVELLAYVGDRLSYRQDSNATEAYLSTARQRISVRRHARLVDYVIQEGCNSRVWVSFTVASTIAGSITVPERTLLLTRVPGAPPVMTLGSPPVVQALAQGPQAFETMASVNVYASNNVMKFHSWGGVDCCLPKGATTATLRGPNPNLQPGDVLIFEETLGRATGNPADADPSRRVAVLLTSVTTGTDPIGAAFVPPLSGDVTLPPGSLAVTEIAWAAADALPFSIQVSLTVISGETSTLVDSAIARGNVVLADNGRTVTDSFAAPPLPAATGQQYTSIVAVANPVSPPFNPQLSQTPLTYAAPLDSTSAASAFGWSMSGVLPSISLASQAPYANTWNVVVDLLRSPETMPSFVVEIDNDGDAHLRFGDDDYGLEPDPGTQFVATYRIGNGTDGNVGAATIAHIVPVATATGVTAGALTVDNRVPASGAVDPETLEHVRQSAPFAFRTQERAVTAADYAYWLDQRSDVMRAAATFRWTGSWYTVFNSVERENQSAIDAQYATLLESYLEQYRVVGKDLEIDIPLFVPLDIAASVCVKQGYFRGDVEAALDAVFSSQPGAVFDPASFDFGQTVYLSPLYAAAQSVQGVDSIVFTQFEPRGIPSRSGLVSGSITMQRLEIARVANDPNFPENGQITFTMLGGQ